MLADHLTSRLEVGTVAHGAKSCEPLQRDEITNPRSGRSSSSCGSWHFLRPQTATSMVPCSYTPTIVFSRGVSFTMAHSFLLQEWIVGPRPAAVFLENFSGNKHPQSKNCVDFRFPHFYQVFDDIVVVVVVVAVAVDVVIIVVVVVVIVVFAPWTASVLHGIRRKPWCRQSAQTEIWKILCLQWSFLLFRTLHPAQTPLLCQGRAKQSPPLL